MAVTDRRYGVVGDIGIKAPCRVATTGNITLSGLQTIDGVSVAANDRVLVKDQTDGSENGIYVASSTEWSRARDFNGQFDAAQGTLISVASGTANGSTLWQLATSDPTIGTDSLTFKKALLTNASTILYDSDLAKNGGTTVSVLTADRTVNIPTDYSDLQSAFDGESHWHPNGYTITVNIESGHSLTGGLLLTDGDYSHFKITAADDSVSLDAAFSGVSATPYQDYGIEADSLIVGFNCSMPVLGCKIDMGSSYGNGYTCIGGRGFVESKARELDRDLLPTHIYGVVNAGGYGLFVQNGHVEAYATDWSGAGVTGIHGTLASIIDAQVSRANNCTDRGVFSSRGSSVHFYGGTATGCGDGARCHRARLNVDGADLSSATGYGLVGLNSATIGGGTASSGPHNLDVSGAGSDGALIQASCIANLNEIIASGCGGVGINARNGSNVTAQSADCTNCTGQGVVSFAGSTVNFNNGDASGSNGGGAADQIVVSNGAFISAVSATGNLSQTAITPTANGIIFQ